MVTKLIALSLRQSLDYVFLSHSSSYYKAGPLQEITSSLQH